MLQFGDVLYVSNLDAVGLAFEADIAQPAGHIRNEGLPAGIWLLPKKYSSYAFKLSPLQYLRRGRARNPEGWEIAQPRRPTVRFTFCEYDESPIACFTQTPQPIRFERNTRRLAKAPL